jgi:hypothetical protein
MSAKDILDRLRRALENPADPEHPVTREAVSTIGGRVVRMVESVVQDPSWSMLSVEDVAGAASAAGLSLDELDLALATLYLEGDEKSVEAISDRELTAEERQKVDQAVERMATAYVEGQRQAAQEHHEAVNRLRGPNRVQFDG